jgi:hypothetical protein
VDYAHVRRCRSDAAALRDCLRPLRDDLAATPDGPAVARARQIVEQTSWTLLDLEEALTALAMPEDGGNTRPR